MRIDVFTIFPEVIDHYADASILGRARQLGRLDLRTHDIRESSTDPHHSVDDAPFGGGPGMVLAPQPLFDAVEAVDGLPRPLYLLTPSGRRFDQAVAAELASLPVGFSLVCGRYEGVDQRVADHLVDGELSVGDFVLAGGELAALVVVEAVARLLPGVLGNEDSSGDESFAQGLLEYPHYTRPAEFRGWEVPPLLRSGDHGRVSRWRQGQALIRTLRQRPDLMAARGGLSADEVSLLVEMGEVRLLRDHGYDW
ncbi:MAG TPA: tRNA (guanosine(37)-N1)-methyltransferase TrmD [Acidimicrobiales bacterium]|jgi:tRNA (guanine37-N1)-methyltransferase|nr:tRNA (guanosine(37)-N1)-methyltransferase TrmD [Acidimicrobiales bacterium]